MIGDVVLVSSVVGAAVALRYVALFVVIVWSLRADEKGRRHAIRVLELLSSKRTRRPP
ncbi:hypothetical protein [Actinosynnema sp. ALI-1.44]|uniref:hypothetical protein n=1 Tax=Actinosynnema sp. ALI-1.44 TaxID=1933779 RepID=UPI00143E0408|nr:hypothetical protein [Actinosynnema sp. ALI-1.44]